MEDFLNVSLMRGEFAAKQNCVWVSTGALVILAIPDKNRVI